MAEAYSKITLATLGGGAAEELFQRELSRVLENIADCNTAAEAKRRITLVVEFTPTSQRDEGNVLITADSKIAPFGGASANVSMGRRDGKMEAYESNFRQQQLQWDQELGPKGIAAPQEGVVNGR